MISYCRRTIFLCPIRFKIIVKKSTISKKVKNRLMICHQLSKIKITKCLLLFNRITRNKKRTLKLRNRCTRKKNHFNHLIQKCFFIKVKDSANLRNNAMTLMTFLTCLKKLISRKSIVTNQRLKRKNKL